MPSLPRGAPTDEPCVVAFPRLPELERARGFAEVGFKRSGAATVISDLSQSGCAKVRLPRPAPGARREAVLINTAGGLTDGDRLGTRAEWAGEACAVVTSQAAERIYRSRQAPAHITNEIDAGPKATAFWLPQETILFDRARLMRRTDVRMHPSARLIACEGLVFGRVAMGERLRAGMVVDAWRIRAGDRLVFADTLRLEGDIEAELDKAAIGAGARALASVIYAGSDAAEQLEPLRALTTEADAGRLASSCLGFVTVTRILASSGDAAQRLLSRVLLTLMGNQEGEAAKEGLPRVWSC